MYELRFEGTVKDPSLQKILWSRLHASTFDWNFNPDVQHEGSRSAVEARTSGIIKAVDQISRLVHEQMYTDLFSVRRTDNQSPTYDVSLTGTLPSTPRLTIERIVGEALAALWYRLQELSIQAIQGGEGEPTMLSVDAKGVAMVYPEQSLNDARQEFLGRFLAACPYIQWESGTSLTASH